MTFPISLRARFDRNGWMVFFIIAYCAIALAGLKTYIRPFSVNCILGVIALSSAATIKLNRKPALRFLWPALIFAALYLFIPAKTILFASVVTAVFFTIETFIGRLNYLAIFCVILMSPIVEYAADIFSFPIRLFLTSAAGEIMQLIDPGTRIEGNMIITGLSEFAVDPACMGLYMLVASFLAGIILIGIIQKKQNKIIKVWGFFICMSIILLLNIVSNLFRIICLVYYNIVPGSFMHEVTGIVCFLAYVIFPAALVIKYYTRRFGQETNKDELLTTKRIFPVYLLHNFFLLSIISIALVYRKDMTANDSRPIKQLNIPGYTTTRLKDQVMKLENKETLIYVKPIAGFFASDHQPMICWSGSGYEFTRVREKSIGNTYVYSAVLQKQEEMLYTAWWYDNGTVSTISQVEWRWDAFLGANRYALINVTAASPTALEKEINKLLILKPFGQILADK